MLGNFSDVPQREKVFIDILQGFGYNGRDRRALLYRHLRKDVQMIEKLGEQMSKNRQKDLVRAIAAIKITTTENILGNAISFNVDNFHALGQKCDRFHAMTLTVKEYVLALIARGRIDLDKMILKGTDQDKIPGLKLVLSVLDHVGSITV